MKRALEAYWKGTLDGGALLRTLREVEEDGWRTQREAGLTYVGVGDATLYDHVLDWAARFGLVPSRFHHLTGLDRYFAMARGAEGAPALEMTKWFDTNYHYLVPEVEAEVRPEPDFDAFLERMGRARELLGDAAVPIVLGPVTLLRLSRLGGTFGAALDRLLPLYVHLLSALDALGVAEVQLHEPALVLEDAGEYRAYYEVAYEALAGRGVALNLVTYFDDLGGAFEWAAALPVDVVTLDFTRGDNLALLEEHGWPAGKALAAGVVDGRNVWRVRVGEALGLLNRLSELTGDALRVSASASLQFVPYSAAREVELPEELRGVLAFADEKLEEVATLARSCEEGRAPTEGAWERFKAFAPDDPRLRERLSALAPDDFTRSLSYDERRPLQMELPLFPTTTIGSFPQTRAVRRLRGRHRRGELSEEAYRAGVDAWIAYALGVQEGLGLDVLVHGEFERSDMVEYFAQKLTGFAFTRHGWVQSYGSRYVRPPVIYADVTRPHPMTAREFEVAQSFTEKPVKGMLTGPVTIVNWSFPRTDVDARTVAFQIALALQEEIDDLQAAGARIVQVDEPALREGLPLKAVRRAEYLTWAVDAFRLATAGALPETQIHTHMCYAEFGEILDAIDRLDADVISIENARSGDETLRELASYGYEREVGPGVYDVHSPVVPEVEFVFEKLRAFATHLLPEQVWVNPDCGLKTRSWEEVVPALRNVVEATRRFREERGGEDER
jgi:5-methyltetrahydropteroyltriglutamate--homocysteine methyltransferase